MRKYKTMKRLVLYLAILTLTCNTIIPAAWAVTPAPPQAEPVPVYDGYKTVEVIEFWRWWKADDNDYVYTICPSDIAHHMAERWSHSYTGWYISPVQVPPLIPLYRLWNSSSHDHLFSVDINEVRHAASSQGYTYEGIAGYVAPLGVTLPQAKTIQRTYYPDTSCHSLQFQAYRGGIQGFGDIAEGPIFQAFISLENVPDDLRAPVVGVPGAPWGLSASAATPTRVDLSWNNISNYSQGIKVLRKEGAHGSYQTIATLPPQTESYADTEVSSNQSYSYKVVAYNAYGDSSPTNEVTIKTPIRKPEAPSQLVAEAVNSTTIKLKWQDNSNNEYDFTVERKSEGSKFTMINRIPANSTTYTDSTVEANKTYTYRVRSWRHLVASDPSNEATVKTPFSYTLPGGSAPGGVHVIEAGLLPKAPSELSAKAGEGKSIRLEWSDNANNERGYRVERFNGQEFVQIADLAANTEAYTDTDIDYGNTYRYRVKAYNNGGVSQPSNEDEVTIYDYAGLGSTGKVIGIVQPLPLPEAPEALKVQAASASSALISWQDKSSNENGFELERKTAGGAFQKIGVLPAGAVSFIDSGLAAGTKYTYRIRSFNNTGYSEYSREVPLTIIAENIMLPSQIEGSAPITLPGQGQTGYIIPGNTGNNTGDLPGGKTDGSGTESPGAADQITVVLTVDLAEYFINGQSRQMDAAPVIIENRTMLPVRAVVEALGGTMAWDPAQQKATAVLGDKTVSVWVGRAMAEAGGRTLQIDPGNPRVMPVIVPPGRTLLPLRFIAENLGCSVKWEPTARTITILYPGAA
jgi:titin